MSHLLAAAAVEGLEVQSVVTLALDALNSVVQTLKSAATDLIEAAD